MGFRRLRKMIKTIAVDIGNVSVFIDTFAFPRALGLTEGFTPEMRELQRRVEWGEIPDELFFSELVKLAPGWSEKRLRTLFDSILLTPVPGMEELLAKLSASGVQVVFLQKAVSGEKPFRVLTLCFLAPCSAIPLLIVIADQFDQIRFLVFGFLDFFL